MKILVATEFAPGRFSKVGVYHFRKDGTGELPMKHNGRVTGFFIRQGARNLAINPAINWVDYQFGTSPVYRISRA